MKPILWVDTQILKFFTKIAKDFNWLAGKDNYFLARVCVVILVLISIFLGYKHDWLCFVVLLLVCPTYWMTISLAEFVVEKEQKREIKSSVKYHADQTFRLANLFLLVLSTIHGLSHITLLVAIFCTVGYLISIDKPPFKKSQAWQKVKGWFSLTVAVPQAEPIPVRAN